MFYRYNTNVKDDFRQRDFAGTYLVKKMLSSIDNANKQFILFIKIATDKSTI